MGTNLNRYNHLIQPTNPINQNKEFFNAICTQFKKSLNPNLPHIEIIRAAENSRHASVSIEKYFNNNQNLLAGAGVQQMKTTTKNTARVRVMSGMIKIQLFKMLFLLVNVTLNKK